MKTQSMLASLSGQSQNSKAGFSLVEVVLAVGIMAMGVVTILGLLPHGMEMSRKTANEQAETRIVDQLVGEIQSADWSTMGGLVNGGSADTVTYFFDDQGLKLIDGLSSAAQTMVYAAQARFADANEVTDGMLMPGKDGKNVANKNLRRVTIEVAVTQNPDFDFANPPAAVPVKRYTQLVAKMRK
jgi:uncharacterized protein (TIGR02598 family)